ncbi:MAG: hypothetical protein IJ727_07790 [Treponema sp.]|nr:hypothetical protein [Treponema sp.]
MENACYYYSTYNAKKDTSVASDNKKKIMILGGGPNRIGQGIEFESQAASHLAKRVLTKTKLGKGMTNKFNKCHFRACPIILCMRLPSQAGQ